MIMRTREYQKRPLLRCATFRRSMGKREFIFERGGRSAGSGGGENLKPLTVSSERWGVQEQKKEADI